MEIQFNGEEESEPHLRIPSSLPSLSEMTVTVSNNLERPFWSDGSPLRCASNSVNMSTSSLRPKRDFRFQVIQVRTGPRWFVWNCKPESDEMDTTEQPAIINRSSGSSDQENRIDESIHRSTHCVSRRKTSNDYNNKPSPVIENVQAIATEDDLRCHVTATNQPLSSPVSEPTIRRIATKPIRQPIIPIDCRCTLTKKTVHLSSPSSSADSFSSAQSSLSSNDSSTFQILSVAPKWDPEEDAEDDETVECTCRMRVETSEAENQMVDQSKPSILITSVADSSK
ncbi:hypothetical protein M3Y98_00575900 [Aphelenchoides besseyi]|nr:hypothetical protein M3Y98_00575900 [Aphelenchoides besseyi]